jgi:cell migration-inducing and hyaluronan-binding protein
MDQGSFVILELPGFATARGGARADSLDALRDANTTAYYKDGDTLWVKLVVEAADHEGPVVEQVGNLTAQATIEVGKESLGG